VLGHFNVPVKGGFRRRESRRKMRTHH